MNIAIFTNNYLPNPYGVSSSIESFRKEFEAMGHTVYIFAPHTKGYVDENKNVFRYPSSIDIGYKISFPLPIPFSFRIRRILKNLNIDIIHSQHPNLLGSAAMRWARKKNIPIVFTWHTLYDKYAHFAPFIPEKFAAWWTIRNAVSYANRCDHVVTPTPSVRKIIRKWGVLHKAIASIATGVDENVFADPNGSETRRRWHIAEDDIVLVYISRFTQEKNIEFLFSCVIDVLKRNPKVKFLAGGDGYLLSKMKQFVAASDVERQVIFPGFVVPETKKDYYAAGNIFVFASKSETQGMILTEAMYSGLPVVAVKAPGVEDVVGNQINGFLVNEDAKEFSQALQRLIDDSSLRQKFAQHSREVARSEYTSKVCAKKLMTVYERAIEEKLS